MKNLMRDIRKRRLALICIVLVIILAIILLVSFISTKANKNKFESEYKTIESNTDNYLSFLTFGYITDYIGSEKLFENNKFTVKDLKDENIFIYAVMSQKENDSEIDQELYKKCADYVDDENYQIVKEDYIKKAVKDKFDLDWNEKEIDTSSDMLYNIKYIKDLKVYILTSKNNDKLEEVASKNKQISITSVDSVSTNKDVKTTVIVSYKKYVVDNENTYIEYYKDKEQSNLVYKININDIDISNEDDNFNSYEKEEILKHKDDFTKYIVTYTNKDDNFIFKSIQKK